MTFSSEFFLCLNSRWPDWALHQTEANTARCVRRSHPPPPPADALHHPPVCMPPPHCHIAVRRPRCVPEHGRYSRALALWSSPSLVVAQRSHFASLTDHGTPPVAAPAPPLTSSAAPVPPSSSYDALSKNAYILTNLTRPDIAACHVNR